MSKEKLVLSIIAILLGLFVAGGAFYIYQVTRTVPEIGKVAETTPTSIPSISPEKNLLIVQEPKEEQVFAKRVIDIKGKTAKNATIIISSQSSDQVIEPNNNGEFTLTHTLEDGVNILKITAVFESGEEQSLTRTVTSTTEDF